MNDNYENIWPQMTPIPDINDLNICCNCTVCLSLIEIISINEKDNIIEFKCSNTKDNHSKEVIKMPIKEYLEKIKKNKNKNIDTICSIHKKDFVFYCFNCSKHLCKNCIKSKQHANHDKQCIYEIEPNDDDLDIIKRKIEKYNLNIKNLEMDRDLKLEKLQDDLNYEKQEENNKFDKAMMTNNKKEEKDLKENKDKYINDILEIKKRYEKEIKARKLIFKNEKKNINNKYKEINYKEIIMHKYKLESLNKKFERDKQEVCFKIDNDIENINNIKNLNEIIYNSYNNNNDNYFYSLNINKIISSCKINKITAIYKISKINEKIRLVGSIFFNKNKNNCTMTIYEDENNKKDEKDLLEFYEVKNNKEKLKINLTINESVVDYSFMFSGCTSLISLPDISQLELNTTNISNLFSECSSLEFLDDISKWKTDTIVEMSYLFSNCLSLKSLPDISKWNTDKVRNMKFMFSFASSLVSLPDISKWNIQNVSNISNMFYGCSLIQNIDISNWTTNNLIDISYLFCKCTSLKSLSDLSKWKTDKIINMSYLFYGCQSLESIPDISDWNTENVIDMSYMFYNCLLIKNLPLISKWKTNNVTNMSYMFYGCSNLTLIPDILNWNTDKLIDIEGIFSDCPSLKYKPDISKWKNVRNQEIYPNKNINEKSNDDFKEKEQEVKGSVYNDDLKFFPQIEFKFNNLDKINKNLISNFKDELKKILKTDNFSIIEIKKGSIIIILTLQYIILSELRKQGNEINLQDCFYKNISNEVKNLTEQLKNHQFISLGTNKPDRVDNDIMDISNEENRKKIVEKIKRLKENKNLRTNKTNNKEINILEASNYIEKEDLERFFNNRALEAEQQENNIKRTIESLNDFNTLFDKEIEKIFVKNVFEYKIDHILLIDKERNRYLREKNNCPNRITRILFHGSNIDSITKILNDQIRDARMHIFGKGAYFTDLLDYAWYYSSEFTNRDNFDKIPKIGETFSCLACEIYYDKTKLEKAYSPDKESVVPKNGIKCGYVDWSSRILSRRDLEEYKGFLGTEYLISDKTQILPLYSITFERVEYLVVWRDYNFNTNNPNNYDSNTFNDIQEFHIQIKKFISRELNSKIYYLKTTKEALKLIKRKKYNKIIIITNGGNNGEYFIKKAREIIGSNTIACCSAYAVENHINWVKNMENVLILKGLDFHKKFFKCVKYNDESLYNELCREMNNTYNYISNFHLNECTNNLFNFNQFKEEGSFMDLEFDNNDDFYN